jgi:hypothetical protein
VAMNSPEKSKRVKRSKQMLEHKQEQFGIRTKTHGNSTSDGACKATHHAIAAAGCSIVNARVRTSHSNQKDLPSVEATTTATKCQRRIAKWNKIDNFERGTTNLTPRMRRNIETRPSLTPRMTSRRYLRRKQCVTRHKRCISTRETWTVKR